MARSERQPATRSRVGAGVGLAVGAALGPPVREPVEGSIRLGEHAMSTTASAIARFETLRGTGKYYGSVVSSRKEPEWSRPI